MCEVSDNVAAHDSKYYQEIEEVYDDLLRTVGQYDQEVEQQQHQQQQNRPHSSGQQQQVFADKSAYRSASAGLECKLNQETPASSAAPTMIFGNSLNMMTNINQPTLNNVNDNNNNIPHDLNNQHIVQDTNFISCDSIIKDPSGQSASNTCAAVSTSASNFTTNHNHDHSQQQQQQLNFNQSMSTTTRPRVISFGSATNYRYGAGNNPAAAAAAAVAAASATTSMNCNQQQRYFTDQATWANSNHIIQNQHYLNEPTHRQKSCSDPALHVLPPDSQYINSVSGNQFSHQVDPSGVANKVPGIKICTIEDDLENSQQASGSREFAGRVPDSTMNDYQPASRECSLPDISNLQFETSSDQDFPMNPTCSSPSKNNHRILTSDNFQDSCQALDGSWASYGCCPTIRHQPHDFNLCQPAAIGRIFSHSDCGLTSSHLNGGGLTICGSGDNIVRSRSHNNIDNLAKQAMFQQQQAIGSSSSNLNSPQSDVNSPGSSTNEHCDPGLMYQLANPPGCYATEETSTLVGVDGSQYLSHDNSASFNFENFRHYNQNPSHQLSTLTTTTTTTSTSTSSSKLPHNHHGHNQHTFSQK